MFKITTKTTKDELTKYLGENVAEVKKRDKNLFDRIAYADKMYKKDQTKVTRKDLVDLVKDVMALLATSAAPAPKLATENQLKKSSTLKKGSAKKAEAKQEENTTEQAEETSKVAQKEEAKVDKKSANKTGGAKKNTTKKSDDAVLAKKEAKVVMPETLELDGSKYECAHDIKSMEDLYKALEAEEVIVFAYSWTKTLLKQFRYFNGILPAPKEFPLDLDVATCIYVSDEYVVAYAVSQYTEAPYSILPDDFEEVEGIRYGSGIEYQIYRQVE